MPDCIQLKGVLSISSFFSFSSFDVSRAVCRAVFQKSDLLLLVRNIVCSSATVLKMRCYAHLSTELFLIETWVQASFFQKIPSHGRCAVAIPSECLVCCRQFCFVIIVTTL